jgi:enamine deaminase RidA (YjgF/YER057c/UK114 family)
MRSFVSRQQRLSVLCVVLFTASGGSLLHAAENRPIDVDARSGVATAVVVDDRALLHTTQLLPVDDEGNIATGDLDAQTTRVLANLGDVLEDMGTNTTQLARLNVYVTDNALVDRVRTLLTAKLTRDVHPAVTYVVTRLPAPAAMLAVDVVASIPNAAASIPNADITVVTRGGDPQLAAQHGTDYAAVLPRGRALYISGMAERADDLEAATAGTMRQLHGVLELLGLGAEHVVHVKAFMKPMADAAMARQTIERSYPSGESPPVTLVEWSNGLPIEIEMIAFIPGGADATETVAHRWQPEEKRSPVYCRFAVVEASRRIYVSGLHSRDVLDAGGQVRDIFAQLDAVLAQADSNFLNMVKATYYVAADDVSQALNDVRPELYDPQRPPAASKATIAGTGDTRRTITIDMIAVPALK